MRRGHSRRDCGLAAAVLWLSGLIWLALAAQNPWLGWLQMSAAIVLFVRSAPQAGAANENSDRKLDQLSRPQFAAEFAGARVSLSALGVGRGRLGAVFSPARVGAGGALVRDAWSSPSGLPPQRWFGPVWSLLYVLMGIAAWLIWRERYHRGRDAALAAYAVQLLLNARGRRCFSA